METVDFKIVFNKKKFDMTFPLDSKVSELKTEIENMTRELLSCLSVILVSNIHPISEACSVVLFPGVPASMQKVMCKGELVFESCRARGSWVIISLILFQV